MDVVKNPNHRFMEPKLSMVIHRTLLIGVGVSDHIKVYYQFYTMFMETHHKNLYPTNQECSTRIIPSKLGEIVMPIFGGGSLGAYSCITIE